MLGGLGFRVQGQGLGYLSVGVEVGELSLSPPLRALVTLLICTHVPASERGAYKDGGG